MSLVIRAPRGDDDEDDVESSSLRESAAMMDAMAYVEEDSQARVNEMIEAEMAATKETWKESSGNADQFFSEMVKGELERIEKGEEIEPFSIERYACEPPASDVDETSWRRAWANCCAQLEHQANRVLNLELAESFAVVSWARHVQDLEQYKIGLEALAAAKEREAERVNLKRKSHQLSIASEIARTEAHTASLLQSHLQLERANAQLRAQIDAHNL